MPVFLLPLLATGLFGAFVGAQIDNAVATNTPQSDQGPSPTKIAYYAAIGMGLFWLAHKAGVLKK